MLAGFARRIAQVLRRAETGRLARLKRFRFPTIESAFIVPLQQSAVKAAVTGDTAGSSLHPLISITNIVGLLLAPRL
jgi:hypothetical protein